MSIHAQFAIGLTAAVLWAQASPARAASETPREMVREGNRLFADKKYAEAHEKYHQAAADLTETPEIRFNQAATFYKRGDYDKAVDLYLGARDTRDAKLDNQITFNLGNCRFRQAVKVRQDLPKAIEHLKAAAGYYRDCLEVDKEMADAKYNLQLTKLMLKHLLDEQRKKQEQQKKQQKNKDQKDKDKQKQQQKNDQQKKDQQKQDKQKKQDQGKEPQRQDKTKQKRPSAADRKKLRKEEAERLLRHAMEDARRRREKRLPQRPASPTPGRGDFKDW